MAYKEFALKVEMAHDGVVLGLDVFVHVVCVCRVDRRQSLHERTKHRLTVE